MPYHISIEIMLTVKDDALLNEAYDYINSTDANFDPEIEKDANNFMQYIYKIIAIRHGLEPVATNGLHAKLHDDFLELRSGRISLKESLSDNLLLRCRNPKRFNESFGYYD